MVLNSVRAAGGAQNVAVTESMLKAVKNSHLLYNESMKKETERKRKIAVEALAEADAKKKKDEQDQAKKTWEHKKNEITRKLKVIEEELKNDNNALSAAISRGSRAEDPRVKESCFNTIKNCQKNIQDKMEEQNVLQASLVKHEGKKPKV